MKNYCDPGWTKFEATGQCYKQFTERLSWTEARQRCRAQPSGDLASVTDDRTNKLLTSLTTTEVWLGGQYDARRRQWRWSDGAPWGYTNWYNRKDRGFLVLLGRSRKWGKSFGEKWYSAYSSSVFSSYKRGYICQYQLQKAKGNHTHN